LDQTSSIAFATNTNIVEILEDVDNTGLVIFADVVEDSFFQNMNKNSLILLLWLAITLELSLQF
jgi:hypothetical protein